MRQESLYPALTIRRRPPVNHDDPACDLSFLRREDTCPPGFVCEMRHAFVSPFGIVFRNGRVVRESVYPGSIHGRNAPTFYKKILLGCFRRIRGQCVVMHNPFYGNYYHWTVEALPRLFSVKDRIRDAKVFLGPDPQPFHAQTLELFSAAGIESIPRSDLALVEDLLMPSHAGVNPVCHEGLISEMGAWLRQRAQGDANSVPGGRNVYLMRGAGRDRRLINEDEVVSLLSGYGFEAVLAEDLTVTQQIRLFAGVKNLVAVHGAGLANMIYMPPGGLVVALINEKHRDPAFFNLAGACHHDIVLLQSRTHGTIHRKIARYDMIADLGKLEHYVRKCLK